MRLPNTGGSDDDSDQVPNKKGVKFELGIVPEESDMQSELPNDEDEAAAENQKLKQHLAKLQSDK